MRHWLMVGLLAMGGVACSSDDDNDDQQEGDTDTGGDSDTTDYPATCQGLYDYTDSCFAAAGCEGAFVQDNFVDTCEGGLRTSDIEERQDEGCRDSILFFCTLAALQENEALFGLPCCSAAYACPSGQVCEPVEGDSGVCITSSSAFPAGAPNCRSDNDCKLGYQCVEGESSSKCVQICVIE